MRQVDLVVVTGSQNNVRAAYSSGTPAIGVSAGNVAAFVDETADPRAAAAKTKLSKTFDNTTSCSRENSAVIVGKVYLPTLEELAKQGGVMLSADEKGRLELLMWRIGAVASGVTARSAREIARLAQLAAPVRWLPIPPGRRDRDGKGVPVLGGQACAGADGLLAARF